jgi:glycine/D-amino acid oxidase-like deaminating enzyme
VAVVGAGIFGVTAALELRRRGWRVTLADPGPLPHPRAASTDISKVIRMDYGTDELYTALMERAFEGWDAWNRTWPEPPYHETGFVLMSRGPMRSGGFEHESFATLSRRGHRLERLDAAELQRRFPAWRVGSGSEGYFNPRAGWAASGKTVERLVGEARSRGVEVREGARMARLLEAGSRVAGISIEGGGEIRADAVVVAGGAWTPKLLPHLAEVLWATAQPVLHFRPVRPGDWQPPGFVVWAADIANTGWYGFPAQEDGTVKVANHGPGRRVDPDAPRDVAPDAEPRFRAFFRETFPGLAEAPLIGSRLCLYCDSWDGNFWVDREREGLVVAAGDSGHGFKFAPVLGGLIADALEGRSNEFLPRFRARSRAGLRAEDARHLAR